MPVPTRQKRQLADSVGGFLGVNLRRDRLSLADGDLARAINADLHLMPGVAVVRHGRSRQFPTALDRGQVRRLAYHNGVRYQIANDSLYRNQVSILTGLSGTVTTLASFRPLNDITTWVFVADRDTMRKDSGSSLSVWGIDGPALTPVIAAGAGTGLTGDYSAVYTYARIVGTLLAHESNPSATPTAVTLSANDLDIDVTASSDSQVTNIRVYRTVSGGTLHLFDQQVANTTATITSSQADSALGTAVETDNDTPNTMGWITEHQSHIFACQDASNPHYLWWSKRFRPESFPADNFLEIGNPDDPLQAVLSLSGFAGVFSRRTKYRVLGNTTSGFVAQEALSSRGTLAPNATLVIPEGAIFPARDGIFITNFLNHDTELSQQIEPLFHGETVNDYAPVDWSRALEQSMAEYKGRLYWGYQTTDGGVMMAVYSRDTQHWYFYNHPMRSLYYQEETDELLGGDYTGLVYILEDGTSDDGNDISVTIEPASRGGRFIRKLFHYIRLDTDAKSGTVAVKVYIDDVLRHTVSVTGNRRRKLLRLPDRLLGSEWRIQVTYSGDERAEIYAAQMLYLPLEPS